MTTAEQPQWLTDHQQKKGGNPAWTPGMPSPNPAGRPRKIQDRRTRITETLLENADGVARAAVEAALAGDTAAQGLILSKVLPSLKAQAERVEFTFDAKASLVEQVESVLQAIADGSVAVDTGRQIIEAIASVGAVRQVEEFQARLEALEKFHNGRR